ncbi:Glycosyltransferase involved in cell wall bisynthesis [Marinobacter daqiaonensis]|uniref:Glycosyltransferase involved in cell wall bisynthesis n=1 Tax=Marinobacter daqiaonensis TaxID=650891 RepID=A0A1I6HWA5_9GAMM|nr:glycosyltransferase [Marinobacter daqiaonensis]SFR58746.1 Glycosyltransferase involved in cell wall bisynthesis [Marinobacter daqiaonensis]
MEQKQQPERILHITFNMGFGGTEQVIRQLVTGLAQEKFINSVLCIDGEVGDIGEQVRREGVEVFAFQRNPGFDRQLIHRIRSMIREFDVRIVHCHQYTPWVYGWMASWGTAAKVIFTEHGRFHPDRYRYKAALINPLMALMTRNVVAISEATRKALARYEFVPAGKIQVVYNGIKGLVRDPEAVSAVRQQEGIPDGHRVLGTVARLDPVKNQAMMLEAFARVLPRWPDTWLLMVGDGPARTSLEQQARTLGIADRVIFTGFRPEPADYLAAMDLFLLTSHTEGTSMTLLEAMSLGIPVIATAVGGNPEIVGDGETGLLVPTDNPVALAVAIEDLLGNDAVRKGMGDAGRKRFDARFSVSPMVCGYEQLYQQMLRG